MGSATFGWRPENYEAAERLGREYSDDLQLVLNDFGWGDGPSGTVELTTPSNVLRRVFSRPCDTAARQIAGDEEERAEAQKLEEHNRLVAEVCRLVLASLDGEQSP